jgi:hypothetical protein
MPAIPQPAKNQGKDDIEKAHERVSISTCNPVGRFSPPPAG